jgi:predicted RNA binding protein YcfA (HicA-like mRNA interferase family)
MPKLRVLSGKKLVKIFEGFGFVSVSQKGSHIKMHRFYDEAIQMLVIPNHPSVSKGTLKEIYNQALQYISEKEIKRFFYT